MKTFRLFLLLLADMSMVSANAMAGNLSTLKDRILQNLKQQKQEKVYLSFDNISYSSGDTIFYKADVVEDPYRTATRQSSVLYVEILSPSGWIMERQKLHITDGHAEGAFCLSESITGGFYEIRAYTAWMLNFTNVTESKTGKAKKDKKEKVPKYNNSKECWGIFSRVLPIYGEDNWYGGTKNVNNKKTSKDDVSLSVSFYPESGNIIKGVPARVAFEVTDCLGRYQDIHGWINSKKGKIKEIRTAHDGKGVFCLSNEETSEMLTAEFKTADGTKKFRLPAAQSEGYVMNILNGKDVKVRIMRNSQTKGEELALAVCSYGKMTSFVECDMSNDLQQEITLKKDSLTTGVNVATLYNCNGHIIAQRVFFVNRHDMAVNVEVDYPRDVTVKPHEKIDIDIRLTEKDSGKPLAGESFSIAVTKDCSGNDAGRTDIMTYLLLSSEIRGYVANPQYYFAGNDIGRAEALDVLMMVQGWTRYDYAGLASDEGNMLIYEAEKGLSLKGRILDTHYNSDIYYSSAYNGNGYTEKQTSDGEGYGERRYWTGWNNKKKRFWLRMDLMTDNDIRIDEKEIFSSDEFSFDIPAFCGKGYAYLMMNRQSLRDAGIEATDRSHHHIGNGDVKDNSLERTYIIDYKMPIAPWPRKISYYETTHTDRNFAANASVNRMPVCETDFHSCKPTFSMDINSLMAYLSVMNGRIADFRTNSVAVNRSINLVNPNALEILPVLGISGDVAMFVDGRPVSEYDMANMGANSKKAKWPADMSFKRIDVYTCRRARAACLTETGNGKINLAEPSVNMPTAVNFITDQTIRGLVNMPQFTGNQIEFNGFSTPVDFYRTDCLGQKLQNLTDRKSGTLLWIPQAVTDDNGMMRLSSFNGSENIKINVKVEGITKDGKFIIGK